MRGVEKTIIVLLLLCAVAIGVCSQGDGAWSAQDHAVKASGPTMKSTPSGLSYIDLVEGTGVSPEPGKVVKIHYTAWLQNGTVFDSTAVRFEPFAFVIGRNQAIPGLDEGVTTMKVGGKRKLVIPPQLAYGDAGAGGVIPPKTTLIYEVELVEVGE